MKKYLALLLALTMALSLFGCTSGTNVETSAPTTEEVTEATTLATEETTEATEEVTEEPTEGVSVMTHEEFAAAALDTEVTVETYVQAVESWYDGAVQVYAQSEDGGYYIYSLACTKEEADLLVPGTKIRVTGWKVEWSGEVEISDATYEILEGDGFIATATDYTDLLGTDELAAHMNELAVLKGLTVVASTDANGNEAPYLYTWDGSGKHGDDLYFNVALGDQVFTFTVNAYMIGTDVNSEVYQAVEALQIGDVIDVEGFLYWYNAVQTHVTSITVNG